jgi:flagellar basal-body rod protein FlgC
MINLIPGAGSTSAALNAERIRMDVISENIANMNTTKGPDGRPYQRQQVVFETVLKQTGAALETGSVQVARVESDQRAPKLVHNPGHPDADANGMVAMPDINLHEEMADLISASRTFEANLSVLKNARGLALQTLSIGKR